MAEVKWTDFAIKELNQIGEFIALDSIRYAELTVSELFSSTEILEKYPYAGIEVLLIQNQNIRQIIKGNYRIIYLIVEDNSVEILTVHHGSRLISNILGDIEK